MSCFRPAVVLEAIELRHRIAALERDRNSWPVLPIVGIVLLWILLSRWWSFL